MIHSWDKPHLIMTHYPFNMLVGLTCYIFFQDEAPEQILMKNGEENLTVLGE